MRRLMVPVGALCVAVALVACGSSRRHARVKHSFAPPAARQDQVRTGMIEAGTTTVGTRAVEPSPRPSQIARAATRTAAKPGFTARVHARIELPQFSGDAVTAIGSGRFDPASDSGTLAVAVQLPGLLGLAGPLPMQVRLVGGEAYAQVPSGLAGELSTSVGWLEESISALGLGDTLSPQDILREVARDATTTVPGQRARVSLDPRTGLVRAIVISYSVAGGYHVHVRLALTGFSAQAPTAAPPPEQTGDLGTVLTALGF